MRTPHPRRAVIPLVLGLLMTAGCGGGEPAVITAPSTSAPPPVRAAPAGPAPSPEELNAAALVVADLPAGYRAEVQPSEPPQVSPARTSSRPECASLFEAFGGQPTETSEESNAIAEVAAGFMQGDLGPFLQQRLALYDNADLLEVDLALARNAAATCGQFTVQDAADGSKFEISLVPQAFPVLGDETTAVLMSAHGSVAATPVMLRGYLVVSRVGWALNTIVHFGLSEVDVAETERITKAAVTKLAQLS